MIWLTNIGIIEKGRLIEIEALYVSLCGLAIIFWLSFFLQKKSPWLTWLSASVFLGLGLLAKGPTHLLFFYGTVIAVLAYWKEWRVLVHPAHFVGLAVMIGIAAAWAIPFVHRTTLEVAVGKWSGQYTGRLEGAGVAVSRDGRQLYTVNPFKRSFSVFDPITFRELGTLHNIGDTPALVVIPP